MEKQELLNQKLYYLTVGGQNPFMMNNEFVLLYSDKSKAETIKTKFSERFACQVENTEIMDNDDFVKKMLSFGFEKFIYNGEGNIYKFVDFHDGTEIIKHIANESGLNNIQSRPVYAQVLQPGQRAYRSVPQSQPKDKNATVSLIFGIISYVFLIPFASIIALVFGIISINNAKKEGRKKEGKAIAGIVLGAIQTISMAFMIVTMIIMAINGEL